MKKLKILLVVIILSNFSAYCQELMTETGLSFTSFNFKDSQGNNLENVQPATTNFLNLGYRHNLLNKTLHFVGGLSFNKYEAIGSNDPINLYYKWETTYLAPFLGLDVKLIGSEKVAFYLRTTTSLEFMLQGTQTLNNQIFNLKNVEEFDTAKLLFRGGAIIDYSISETLSIFTHFKYGQSTESGDTQKLKFNTTEIGIGLAVKLNAKKQEQILNQTQEK